MTERKSSGEATRKPRPDAWWAALPEEECWEVWEKFRRLPWQAVAKWLREEKGLEVSRAALYRFGAWIRPQASARRLELAVLAREEAKGLAQAAGARQEVAEAFMAMGAEAALRSGNADEASGWIRMAASLLAAAQKDAELRLREKAQATAEESLRLAREKFEAAEKRLAAVREACEGAKAAPGGLTPETLRRIEEAAGLL